MGKSGGMADPADESDFDDVPGLGLRKIIHVDMDAFYASVEQRDDPSLRGLPVAVGGDGPRGVLTTCSYEARKFGCRSAMPSVTAKRLCPQLIFVRPRFPVYTAISHQIREIKRFAGASPGQLGKPTSYTEATTKGRKQLAGKVSPLVSET